MSATMFPAVRRARGRAVAGALLLLGSACSEDRTGPSPGTDPATNPVAAPTDAGGTALAVLEKRTSAPGIVFGSTLMDVSLLGSVHTGTLKGGGLSGSNVISWLSAARAKHARVVLKMCNGADSYVKNSDGTFSLTKWKNLVNRFRHANLAPYINDGTLLGHYLIDEPQRSSRWGGRIISPATLEEMAQYSKQIWPTLTTFVRTEPEWLASFSITYRYLDAGWAQYVSNRGNAGAWVADQVAAANRKGLGLAVGINALDGGNGSSRIPGDTRGKWAMSASEVRSYGAAMLAPSYACAFYVVHYDHSYYGRSDIKSAFAYLSDKARTHTRTSCRQ